MIVNKELLAMLDELKPCPFCGGSKTELRDKTFWTGQRTQLINVEVHHWCDTSTAHNRGHIELARPTREEAIAAWNTRAQPQTGGGDGHD